MSLLNRFLLLYAPTDTEAGAIEDKSLSKEEAIDFLGDDEPTEVIELDDKSKKSTDKKETEEVKETETEEAEAKPEEEKDELKEIEEELEEELEEPDEEKLELMIPVRRKEILAKYPTLFKDFPYLERAYYRDQQFTEMLPTIEDAKTAVEKSTALDNFEVELLQGKTDKILSGVKQLDRDAFNKIVDNYLPALKAVDEPAFFHVVGGVINRTIMGMVEESRRSNNAALETAAQLLNQYVFGRSDFKDIKPLSEGSEKKDNSEEERVKAKEQQLVQRQFEDARDTLSTRVENVLKSTIEANIDPKGSMTDYVKKNAIREAKENLTSLIERDSRFKTLLDKLWERAFDNDFSKADVDRIKSAYLSKAKTLLPDVIKKARNEALRGLGKRVKDDSEEESNNSKKGHAPVGKSTTSSNSGKSVKEQAKTIPRDMRSIDFLMKD